MELVISNSPRTRLVRRFFFCTIRVRICSKNLVKNSLSTGSMLAFPCVQKDSCKLASFVQLARGYKQSKSTHHPIEGFVMAPMLRRFIAVNLVSVVLIPSALSQSAPVFEEVLVTAEKRSESLQDLSQAVTALTAMK